jgi:Asp-tRNA(Asn)/Glu-tRNA(Gln) amidotransferase A subunit family amidase
LKTFVYPNSKKPERVSRTFVSICNIIHFFLYISSISNQLAHAITISTEINNYVKMSGPEARQKLLYSNRILTCVADTLQPVDYVRSQQIRTRVMHHVMNLFKPANGKGIDLILTPSTAITSPELAPSLLTHGMSNNPMTSDAMRYAFLANFIGIPAVQVPAGFDSRGLPVGLQLMAEWWNEELLLRMAKVCEQTPGVERKRPAEGWYGDILN